MSECLAPGEEITYYPPARVTRIGNCQHKNQMFTVVVVVVRYLSLWQHECVSTKMPVEKINRGNIQKIQLSFNRARREKAIEPSRARQPVADSPAAVRNSIRGSEEVRACG